VGEGHPYWSTHVQHANNMATLAGDEKFIPDLKIIILWDMADSIHIWFNSCPKIPALVGC
jgi:hypothetical protein